LKSIKPAEAGKRVLHWDAQVPGLAIRVTDKSNAECRGSFVLVTRFPGSKNPAPRRIGDYPAMTLTSARKIAREWREDLARGIDPKVKEAERLRMEARRRADTFGACFEAFADEHLSTLRSGKIVKAAVEKHILPKWADRPISEIRRADINQLIKLLRKHAPIQANRVLSYLKRFFAWAVDEELLEASPAAAVKKPAKENTRDRVLSEAEIRAIWLACGELGAFGRAFKLMLLTGQRRNEVARMTWGELDAKQKIWTLSRERTKADRAHEIPLSATATSIIVECPKLGNFVFSSGRSTSAISGWSNAKAKLDMIAAQAMAGDSLAPWHLHDLRRTCATYLAKSGTDRVVISKILNHAEGGVTSLYERHSYDQEKRRALDLWAERLKVIVEGREGEGNVVSLRNRVPI